MAEYIEREALKKSIREKANPDGCTHITPKDVYSSVLTIVECEPAADVVKVKRGKWIGEHIECSNCGRSIYEICDADSYLSYGIEDELDYCPFCGAKMD